MTRWTYQKSNSIFLFREERERRKGILWNSRMDEKGGNASVCVSLSVFTIHLYPFPPIVSWQKSTIFHVFFPSEGGGKGEKKRTRETFPNKRTKKRDSTRDSLFGQKYVKYAAVKKGRETKSRRIFRPCAHFLSIQCIAFLFLSERVCRIVSHENALLVRLRCTRFPVKKRGEDISFYEKRKRKSGDLSRKDRNGGARRKRISAS